MSGERYSFTLIIDSYSDRALRFYRRAFPDKDYDVIYDEETGIISVGYGAYLDDGTTKLAS